MRYVNPNNEYPRFQGDIKIAHPEWEPSQPLPTGWRKVKSVPRPLSESGMAVIEEFPEEIKGELVQKFSTRPLTEQELTQLEEARVRWIEEQQELGML